MTAKEMFEKLGYKIITNDNQLLTYRKEFALGGEQEFIFHKKDDGVYFESTFRFDFLSYKELQAINKQVEELGWLDE